MDESLCTYTYMDTYMDVCIFDMQHIYTYIYVCVCVCVCVCVMLDIIHVYDI